MTVDTHCLPTGALGTGELPVPNISAANCTTSIPSGGIGHGNIRGVIVYFHGLIETFPPVPYGFPSSTTPGFANDIQSFVTGVVADGWIVLGVPNQEDFYNGPACLGIQNDIANDAGDGSRYLASTLHTMQHIVDYIDTTFAPGIPIVVMGFSLGAMRALQIVANRTDILGYIAHCPPTILSNAAFNYTTPADFNTLNTSGIDLSQTFLNGVAVPGIVGYGTNDAAVGFAGFTTCSNSGNVSSVTTLTISSTAGFVVGAAVQVTGLSGGSSGGVATFGFTGIGTGTLTGATLLNGSGSFTGSRPVTQSDTVFMINAALAASKPVTKNTTADHHEFTTTDANTYVAYVASTLDPLAPKAF